MEEVLDTYALPYDPEYPVVRLDEKSVQLLDHVREPLLPVPGYPARVDHEYKRCGTVNLFIEFEPLTGQRSVWTGLADVFRGILPQLDFSC